jgi:hypothetical protein
MPKLRDRPYQGTFITATDVRRLHPGPADPRKITAPLFTLARVSVRGSVDR